MASIEAFIAKGVRRYPDYDQVTGIPLEWYGHSFNPPDYNGVLSIATYGAQRPTAEDEMTSVNMAPLYPGTEVSLGNMTVLGPYTPPATGTRAYIRWVQGNLPYLIGEYQWSPPAISAGGWYTDFFAIGYKPDSLPGDVKEIYQDAYTAGDEYECQFRIYENGGATQLVVKTLAVFSVNTSKHTLRTPGMIWVEGANINFISTYGWEHIIKHDGVVYDTGISATGAIWVPSSSSVTYLEYIDSSGNKRRTHNGDILDSWIPTGDGVGSTGHTPGHIWTESGFNSHALMFINYSGTQVRISNGDINSNRY